MQTEQVMQPEQTFSAFEAELAERVAVAREVSRQDMRDYFNMLGDDDHCNWTLKLAEYDAKLAYRKAQGTANCMFFDDDYNTYFASYYRYKAAEAAFANRYADFEYW
jgi:hypothetical protein